MEYAEPRLSQSAQSKTELEEEARKIRRLQTVMNMVMSEIAMSSDMTVEMASEMAANMRRYALSLFPGKELAWDLIYKPRLQRLMHERFRLQ
jgi:hypothetical protein